MHSCLDRVIRIQIQLPRLPLHLVILSGVISPLISRSILGTFRPGEFIFQCHIFLPFHRVHVVLKARMLKWFTSPFSSGPCFVRNPCFGCETWTLKKAERRRIDAFELWCWRRLLGVPWTARRPNQSILKEISPEYSLEGRMLKLKPQHFGYLM